MNEPKQLVLDYINSVWNKNDADALMNLTTTDFIYHFGDKLKFDHQGFLKFLSSMYEAFPDWNVKPVQIISENDMVAVQWSGEVTHNGVFHGIQPTGKKITVSGINIYKVKDGKIEAEWEQTDTISILSQLGALPA